jgi:thymidylate kinase
VSVANQRLIAVDGVNGEAVVATAKKLASGIKQRYLGLSAWDASGIFGEVTVAEDSAGRPSARTLLLLYAADLAFRLRWEIRPALDEGLQIVAAPYVQTAIAFGYAAGLDKNWLIDMFGFALEPGEQCIVTAPAANAIADRQGFVEYGCEQLANSHAGPARRILMRRTRAYLNALARSHAGSGRQVLVRA